MLRGKLLINIIADDREPESEVIRSLSELKNAAVQIRRLAIGDYQADNRLIAERKTLKDIAISTNRQSGSIVGR